MCHLKMMKPGRAAGIALVLAISSVGCDSLDDLLDVKAPSRILAENLEDPASAELLVLSSFNAFRCAFTHYVNVSGLVGWELKAVQNGGSLPLYDSRSWTRGGWAAGSYARADCASGGAAHYVTLSTSRWLADEVLRRLDGWGAEQVPNKPVWDAELAAWAGYSYHFLGVSMCSVAFDVGPENPPEHALERAIERFDQAIAAAEATGRNDILNVARIGKGRTLLSLGRLAEAAATVADVPAGFRYDMPYSSIDNSTQNRQYRENHVIENFGVGDLYHALEYEGVPDPRVVVANTGHDVAGYGVELWHQLKYMSYDDPIPLARWEEAQLIIAEAALADGRPEDAVAIINTLHANAGLPAFASTGPDEIMEMIIYNRRAELFLESHHLEDLKRYDLPLYPAPGEPAPLGGVYRSQRCFLLPDEEVANNPNIAG